MAISKVTLNGTTLMDATTATAAAADVIAPKTAMLKNGVVTTGTGTTPTGTKSITITENGTTTEDVTNYASAEITVNVQGGGSSPFVKLYETTLTEAVQAVKVDINESIAGYDFYFLTCYGTFVSADWWYWNVNSTAKVSGQYTKSKQNIQAGLIVAKTNSTGYIWGGTNTNGDYMFPMTFKSTNDLITDLQYLYIQGYSKQMQVGTRITLWGANYEDI